MSESAPGSLSSAAARILVRAGQGDYPVLVGRGLFAELPELLEELVDAHRYALITDDNVARHHAESLASWLRDAGLDVTLLTFPPGEASKTRKSWSILTDEMFDAGLGRDTCVLAAGGGVTTDLGGFVAATFMRGVPLVLLPTSYLAMIDASVGDKTGVDVRHGKNLVGAFHAPRLVVADVAVLGTLPVVERAQGLVEAFKHGAILDAEYFTQLEAGLPALLAADAESALGAVRRSVELKAAVVTADERENGYRQILNFGHTVGHALEAASDFAVGHGAAVALGMVAEARLGEAIGTTDAGTAERLAAALAPLLDAIPEGELPTPERIASYLGSDKKARSGLPRYVLLRRLGEVDPGEAWTHAVPEPLVMEALHRL